MDLDVCLHRGDIFHAGESEDRIFDGHGGFIRLDVRLGLLEAEIRGGDAVDHIVLPGTIVDHIKLIANEVQGPVVLLPSGSQMGMEEMAKITISTSRNRTAETESSSRLHTVRMMQTTRAWRRRAFFTAAKSVLVISSSILSS